MNDGCRQSKGDCVKFLALSVSNGDKRKHGWDIIGPAADMGGDFLVVDMGNHDLTLKI